ncbi:MAG: hypothetical protein AB7G93_15875 [Bdellovibrionales bacterium]
MFFFALAVFLPVIWILPWWGTVLAAALMGIGLRPQPGPSGQAAGAAALVWTASAYLQDIQNEGRISEKLSGLFHLPAPHWLFALVALTVFMTALFWLCAGRVIAQWYMTTLKPYCEAKWWGRAR